MHDTPIDNLSYDCTRTSCDIYCLVYSYSYSYSYSLRFIVASSDKQCDV